MNLACDFCGNPLSADDAAATTQIGAGFGPTHLVIGSTDGGYIYSRLGVELRVSPAQPPTDDFDALRPAQLHADCFAKLLPSFCAPILFVRQQPGGMYGNRTGES